MKKRNCFIAFFICLSFSCAGNEAQISCISNDGTSTKGVTLSASKITRDTKFRLELSKIEFDHPKNFRITSPSGISYIIVDDSISNTSMSQGDFLSCSIFEINPENLKGVFWESSGVKKINKVFQDRGTYMLYFADNLETESENTFSLSAKINFE